MLIYKQISFRRCLGFYTLVHTPTPQTHTHTPTPTHTHTHPHTHTHTHTHTVAHRAGHLGIF